MQRNIADYEIIDEIYKGQNSTIYHATHIKDNHSVIIKILNEEYLTPETLKQFEFEYHIIKDKNIPGVVKAEEIIEVAHSKAIIMEDNNSISLENYLSEQNLNIENCLKIMLRLTEIISAIHNSEIIHRDLNPSNIIINTETKELHVIDFGLSSLLKREYQTVVSPDKLEGTLAYMSPEQTGRMNRSIDYRTDFYSLGITFYEMLTGILPFEADDPMQFVYSHLAKYPAKVSEVNSQVPEMVSKIVEKLISKNAEDRYQSATGLFYDLEKCYNEYKETKQVKEFKLCAKDISSIFQIPEKLYGREKESAKLVELFDKAASGSREVVFITGEPGIGKSVLINELHKPITERGGYFVSGKFDKFKKDIPYVAIIQAFTQLVKQVLTEDEEIINNWKDRIKNAVGNNGQVLINVIPELELIIGKQSEVELLPAAEAQNRFNMVFSEFVKIFATFEHPLVLFLDDLQWADAASLKLLEIILTESELVYFHFFGAYRANEINDNQAFKYMCDNMEKELIKYYIIKIEALKEKHISALLADTLNAEKNELTELSKLIFAKTMGNPFFVKEFIKALYDYRQIKFEQKWKWNIVDIQDIKITDNVVELMASKLRKLPDDTISIIKTAACIGNTFSSLTISLVTQKPQEEIITLLKSALNNGIVIKLERSFKFIHDKVREAAYSLLAGEEQVELHYKIGKTLLAEKGGVKTDEVIFEIASQLNMGKTLLYENEKEKLIKINLKAAQRAKASAAYQESSEFLRNGSDLLTEKSWEINYDEVLEYYLEWAESEYLSTNFNEAKKLFEIVLEKATDLFSKIRIYSIQIDYYTGQAKYDESLEVVKKALNELGTPLPDQVDEASLGSVLAEANEILGKRRIIELVELPELQDKKMQGAMEILVKGFAPAYMGNQGILMVLITLKMVIISMKDGNSIFSSYAYAVYAIILLGSLKEIDKGYQFGELALKLSDKFNSKLLQGRAIYVFGAVSAHYKQPLRNSFNYYLQAGVICHEAGDMQYYGYCHTLYAYTSVISGENLERVNEIVFEQYANSIYKLKQEQNTTAYNCWRQVLECLRSKTKNNYLLKGDYYNEEKLVKVLTENNDVNGLCHYFFGKSYLCFIFDEFKQGVEIAKKGEAYLPGLLGQSAVSFYYFYYALLLLASCSDADNKQQEEYKLKIEEILKDLENRANHCKENYLHKYKIVKAEIARINNQSMSEVSLLYKDAIAGAKENRFLQEEAIANELAAKYFLTINQTFIASAFMNEARHCYLQWGCKTKAELLEKKYLQLFSSFEKKSFKLDESHSDSGKFTYAFDAASLIKASRTIANEIEMSNLLEKLLKIIFENSGAQNGALIFSDENSNLSIEAYISADEQDKIVMKSVELSKTNLVSASIVRYVNKTKEILVLSNAAKDQRFLKDEYIKLNKTRSIICMPILNQDELVAILYLENNLAENIFNQNRIEVLNILASQAAISIKNARLYEQTIKDKNEMRYLRNYLKNIIDSMPSVLMSVDNSVKITRLNTEAQQLLGITFEEAHQKHFTELFPEFETFSATLPDVIKKRQIKREEKITWNRQGQERIVDLTLYPLVANGVEGGVIRIDDITEKAKLEEMMIQNEKMLMIGGLAAGIAHELNNPLAGIVQAIQLMHNRLSPDSKLNIEAAEKHGISINKVMEYLKDRELLDFMEDIKTSSDRAVKTINNMLDFSRTKSEQYQACDIQELLDNAVELSQKGYDLRSKYGFAKLNIIRKYTKDVPVINCNKSQVQQVFLNILRNGMQEMQKGTTDPGFLLEVFVQDKRVAIVIEDNGPGMSNKVKENIFKPFFTTKPGTSGTGVGLYISKMIIEEKHHGELSVESEEGHGARFVIRLPVS